MGWVLYLCVTEEFLAVSSLPVFFIAPGGGLGKELMCETELSLFVLKFKLFLNIHFYASRLSKHTVPVVHVTSLSLEVQGN